jgi:DNA invertase Pin-like site-specific DNA recombinase
VRKGFDGKSLRGAARDRPQLAAALDYMRKGDTLAVSKLDRMARSLKQLIETVEEMERRGIPPMELFNRKSRRSNYLA